MLMAAALKPKRCKACRETFTPARPLQAVCGPFCAGVHALDKRLRAEDKAARAERKRDRERLRQMRPLRAFLADAQKAVNAYVRLRDAHLPCISCGTTRGTWDAGHYRTRKAAPELRFDLDNLHKQCSQCNTFDAGNLVAYRANLLARIGPERVARLEGPHPTPKWTREGLNELRARFTAMARELERRDAA